jgi:hypothetical protein
MRDFLKLISHKTVVQCGLAFACGAAFGQRDYASASFFGACLVAFS